MRKENKLAPDKGEKRRVLIVDDERDFVIGLVDVLEHRGYDLQTANSVDVGQNKIENFDAQVALLDIRFGQINAGIDLIAKMKSARPGILCVMMTAYAEIDTTIKALHEGAYDYLRKPLEINELLATLDRCFEKICLEEAKTAAETALKVSNEELVQLNARLRKIVESTQTLSICSGVEEFGAHFLEEFGRHMAATGGSLYLCKEDGLHLLHSIDLSHAVSFIPFPLIKGSMFEHVINEDRPILIHDINKQNDIIPSGWTGYTSGSVLAFPLPDVYGNTIGVLSLHNKTQQPFVQQDIEIGSILASYSYEILRTIRVTEDLRKSEKKYRLLAQNATDCIWTMDMNLRLTYISPSIRYMLGYTPEETLALTIRKLLTAEAVKVISTVFKEEMTIETSGLGDPNRTRTLELEHVRKDGSIVCIEVRMSFLRDREGKHIGITGVSRDITERRKADEALRKALTEVEQLKNRLQAENIYLQNEIKIEHNFEKIISQSKVIKKVLRKVEQVSSTNATVLILGETGTGKELIARAIHSTSMRKDRPLVKVNCAAIPATLIESELFGHEKGAFTGAFIRKIGRFELADGGTIFLDEIGDLPLALQAKLLRILQEGEFERLGNPRTTKVDVRVIAATNRNLEKAVRTEKFRQDLYYRLNVFPIKCPALRDHKEDIPVLVNHFIKKYGAKLGKNLDSIPLKVMNSLQAYYWPGNVRELENIIERSIILTNGSTLQLDELFDHSSNPPNQTENLDTIKETERSFVLKILEESNWVIGGQRGAAARLGIAPSTLRDRINKFGLKKSL